MFYNDALLQLHTGVIDKLAEIYPAARQRSNEELTDSGFIILNSGIAVPFNSEDSSFEADKLELYGFAALSGVDRQPDDLRSLIMNLDVILYADGSPYAREQDIKFYPDANHRGHHTVIIGPEVVPTLTSNPASEDLSDSPELLIRFLNEGKTEILRPTYARTILDLVSRITANDIDLYRSI